MTTSLVSVWLHVLGVVVWIGGLTYQAHVVMPQARRHGATPPAQMPRRGTRVTLVAIPLGGPAGVY